MELSINISGQASNQRDENFRKWKAESFPAQIPRDDDPKKMMDKELYKYAEEDKFDELFGELRRVSSAELSSIIYTQVSPSGNSLLHVSASNGSKHVTELLLHHFPLLMMRKNFHDDTALHLAAGAGQPETTTFLINKAKGHGGASDFPNFLEMKNDRGNTALHDAVINGHDILAHFLVSESSKLSYSENNERKSPLYLAVENSDEKMLTTLMDTIRDDVDLLNKLEGKSPVPAAVQGRKTKILEQIADKMPDLLCQKDGKGRNALHLASLIGYLEGVQFLLKKIRNGAFEYDDEGLYPIHVASKNGHVKVVKELINLWPDPKEFLTRKSKNILHVAAENDRENVVRYILRNLELGFLLNGKDEDGNTPFHLATKNGCRRAVIALIQDRRVQKESVNSENMTPFDVIVGQCQKAEAQYFESPISNGKDMQPSTTNCGDIPWKDHPVNAKLVDHEKSTRPKAVDLKDSKQLDYNDLMMIFSIFSWFTKREYPFDEIIHVQRKPFSKEDMIKRIDTLLVVAILVSGVTFAGVIQLPQPGHSGGKSIKVLLSMYVGLDVLAFLSATSAAIILCYAQLNDIKFATPAIWYASAFVGYSMYMMFLAFLFAAVLAVRENLPFVAIIILVGVVFFVYQTFFYVLWLIPPSINRVVHTFFSISLHKLMFLYTYVVERWLEILKKPNQPEEQLASYSRSCLQRVAVLHACFFYF